MESPLSSRALILAALTEGPNFGLGIIQEMLSTCNKAPPTPPFALWNEMAWS